MDRFKTKSDGYGSVQNELLHQIRTGSEKENVLSKRDAQGNLC